MESFSSDHKFRGSHEADRRSSERAAVNYRTWGEDRARGEVEIQITNISLTGFMVTGEIGLSRGERLLVGFPVVGHRDAFVVWVLGDRTGFQFDRPIVPDDMKNIVLMMSNRAKAENEGFLRSQVARRPRTAPAQLNRPEFSGGSNF